MVFDSQEMSDIINGFREGAKEEKQPLELLQEKIATVKQHLAEFINKHLDVTAPHIQSQPSHAEYIMQELRNNPAGLLDSSLLQKIEQMKDNGASITPELQADIDQFHKDVELFNGQLQVFELHYTSAVSDAINEVVEESLKSNVSKNDVKAIKEALVKYFDKADGSTLELPGDNVQKDIDGNDRFDKDGEKLLSNDFLDSRSNIVDEIRTRFDGKLSELIRGEETEQGRVGGLQGLADHLVKDLAKIEKDSQQEQQKQQGLVAGADAGRGR